MHPHNSVQNTHTHKIDNYLTDWHKFKNKYVYLHIRMIGFHYNGSSLGVDFSIKFWGSDEIQNPPFGIFIVQV